MTVAIMFVFSIFAAQMVKVQGFESATFSAKGRDTRTSKDTIPALRGRILDSGGTVLASSIEKRTVIVDQTAICTFGTRKNTCTPEKTPGALTKAAQALAPHLGKSEAELMPLIQGTKRYQVIAKDVPSLEWRKLKEQVIPGVYSERTTSRSYPQGSASASLVGFVLADGKPGGGLESMMNEDLVGKPGRMVTERSQGGMPIPGADMELTQAVDGEDLHLTLNANLQWFAQNALAKQVNDTNAVSGTVVVQDVATGRLLAVASYPTFDPTNLKDAKGSLTNKAFGEVFEPGSTSKIMTVAAAMQEGKVTPASPIVVPEELKRADKTFHDSHPHGVEHLTVAGVLAESSNMGTILIGEQLQKKTLEEYLRKFGVGAPTGMKFPGESSGLLAPASKWNGSQHYTIMFGQGLSVTAVQASAVFQTIANGGVRIPPRVVDSVTKDGKRIPVPAPEPIKVVSPATAAGMSQMLEGVVSEEGTAPKAKIDGYRVAGKTGTADRVDPATGRYSGKTASFIGFVPADKPAIVVSVIVQRPVNGYFGGTVAAPVFHDVATFALQTLGIPPTGSNAPEGELKLDTGTPNGTSPPSQPPSPAGGR